MRTALARGIVDGPHTEGVAVTIVEVRVYRVPLETRALYNMSNSTVATPESTVVEIVDDSGAIGYGEACLASPQFQPAHDAGVRASMSVLAPAIIGHDPRHVSVINAAMDAAISGHTEGKAALDIACWDLVGKMLDQRVVDLLGGPRMDDITTYHVVGISDAETAAATATWLQDEGHTRLQLAGNRPCRGHQPRVVHCRGHSGIQRLPNDHHVHGTALCHGG